MDAPRYYVEQDDNIQGGGDELPTYDDLAAQNGPNSRFGRWRGWVEKRAAERYMDVTPEERARRRERGWGNEEMDEAESQSSSLLSVPLIIQEPPTPTANTYLHIQTEGLNTCMPPPETPRLNSPLPPLPAVSTRLRPTHLKMNNFGSRFLPHATAPIRCLLPILSGKLLLIGHDEGLSVLDMYPQEWSETDAGITIKGPEEAVSRAIWLGEGVYQLSLLEVEQTGEGTPQGVVLALVGPDPNSPTSKDVESLRTLRMYNLSSLTSLAKWAVAQKGKRPLDLSRPSNWVAQQSPVKKHRPRSSIARGLKSWIEAPNSQPVEPHTSSYHNLLSPASMIGTSNIRSRPGSRSPSPNRQGSDESTWDVVDDLPLRWATDFVPLASTGSRLANSSVISYALWNHSERNSGGRMLAVATKTNILLYETPKGERAFRFVKDFYTPLTPRSITFFQQVVHDVARSPSDTGSSSRFHHAHRRSSDSSSSARGERALTPPGALLSYGTHLSIFVVFDKKAGWIRLADSAVGEVELYDDGAGSIHSRELSSSLNSRRSRYSLDISSALGKWIPPVQCEIPLPSSSRYPLTKNVQLLTRGKQTHILPCPVPTGASTSYPPLRVIIWKSPPTSVTPRVCSNDDGDPPSRFLQLIALGEHGVEVQEISLNFLLKGKGKARDDIILYGEDDVGGDTGFLCVGGHWDQPLYPPYHPLNRSSSTASDISAESVNSMESGEILERMRMEQGLYGWCRKGLEDWRVFWLGGSTVDDDDSDTDD
ncbi:hypothetical protein IW262DRAFT_1521668 [Armillaria fumosa]|nr:hypothetical protein IW262DRAFT_1521668 [Armillaria fumosa]